MSGIETFISVSWLWKVTCKVHWNCVDQQSCFCVQTEKAWSHLYKRYPSEDVTYISVRCNILVGEQVLTFNDLWSPWPPVYTWLYVWHLWLIGAWYTCVCLREEWIQAIRSIADQLQVLEESDMPDQSEEMTDDPRNSKKKRVVCDF